MLVTATVTTTLATTPLPQRRMPEATTVIWFGGFGLDRLFTNLDISATIDLGQTIIR